jgi:hypothetical protein
MLPSPLGSLHADKAEIRQLRAAGDQMQSAMSRVAEWLKTHDTVMPYEVRMAVLEGESAVNDWTEARRLSR